MENSPTKTQPAAGPPVATPGCESPGGLLAVAERLAALGQLLSEANAQLMVHLLRREATESAAAKTPASTAPSSAPGAELPVIRDQLEALGQKLQAVEHREAETAQALQLLQQTLVAGPRDNGGGAQETSPNRVLTATDAHPSALVETAAAAWQRAVFGPELTADAGLDLARRRLCDQVLDGDPAACALTGQLLVFRAASAEKMPPLLKDIGEAYYRWQPKSHVGASPMETALVRSLQHCVEAAGVPNTIELVNPGERFDATRHNTTTRGVEITAVHGWIVLRDNGKVYTKASVTVR